MKKAKGIFLFSGGLDSLLGAKLLLDQGVELIGFHLILPFYDPGLDPKKFLATKLADEINLPLVYYWCGQEYLEMVKSPKHGYGKNFNPCVDCRIYFLQKAFKLMQQKKADFVATGEVVGQRPMSQLKNTLNHITKESNLKGILLRPLSAKNLEPTLAEEKGLVEREKLLGFSGRSRKQQLDLAKTLGISNFSSPSGGCFFTDPNIAKVIKDLFSYHPNFKPLDFFLLIQGRNFRLSEEAKVLISRNEKDGEALFKYKEEADYFFLPHFKGPVAWLKGKINDDKIDLVASLILKYSKKGFDSDKCQIDLLKKGVFKRTILVTEVISDKELEKIRI
jgi:hypothetical protein